MRPTVHVALVDDKLVEQLRRLGESRGFSVQRQSGADALLRLPATDVLVVDEALIPPGASGRAALLNRSRLVLITASEVQSTVQMMAEHGGLAHVLARPSGALPHQLGTTLGRLLGRATPGLAGYLSPGAGITRSTLSATAAKQALIDKITGAAEAVAEFSELAAAVATIATELINNAVFNAPYDFKRDAPIYRDRGRQYDLVLGAGEEVAVAFGHDEQVFALAVRDNFGMLTREALLANFARASRSGSGQIQMQTQGAGVGLFMVLSTAVQLDVHVLPRRQTEIFALVALTKRYRDFAASGHSLNLFLEPQETAA